MVSLGFKSTKSLRKKFNERQIKALQWSKYPFIYVYFCFKRDWEMKNIQEWRMNGSLNSGYGRKRILVGATKFLFSKQRRRSFGVLIANGIQFYFRKWYQSAHDWSCPFLLMLARIKCLNEVFLTIKNKFWSRVLFGFQIKLLYMKLLRDQNLPSTAAVCSKIWW